MDLLAILLLILPAIFKLIKNNDKNHKRIENKEYDISGWLSKFRNEIDNLFEHKDDIRNENGFDEKNIILKDVKSAEQIKYGFETSEPSKEKKIQTAQPSNKNQKVTNMTNELRSDEAEASCSEMNFDFSNEDILKSIIMSEILNKPVSKRGAR